MNHRTSTDARSISVPGGQSQKSAALLSSGQQNFLHQETRANPVPLPLQHGRVPLRARQVHQRLEIMKKNFLEAAQLSFEFLAGVLGLISPFLLVVAIIALLCSFLTPRHK